MDYLRQEKMFNPLKHSKPVTIIGCGGIGSFTAIALAKLGIKHLTVFDDDSVTFHNLPNQMFPVKQAQGKKKVILTKKLCEELSDDVKVVALESKFQDNPILPAEGIVISGVDSMAQRKEIWKQIRFNPCVSLYIDGRLGRQSIRVQAVNPLDKDEVDQYEKSLYTDKEAEDLTCTDRSIIDVGFAVAAVIVRLVRGFLTQEAIPKLVLLSMKELTLTTIGGRNE